MALDFIIGMLSITNMLIAIFILLYSFRFLTKTTKREDRMPWDYLFISAFIFLLYQIFGVVANFSDPSGWPMDASKIKLAGEFLFSGLILLAFISQHDLILRSPMIMISRKADQNPVRTEEEKKVEWMKKKKAKKSKK